MKRKNREISGDIGYYIAIVMSILVVLINIILTVNGMSPFELLSKWPIAGQLLFQFVMQPSIYLSH